jgi:hypothetical protein
MPITGTSFAAPTALRTGIALKAHFGKLLTPIIAVRERHRSARRSTAKRSRLPARHA